MGTNRIEAFSDGVMAIIVTIMILELHPPTEPGPAALLARLPAFLSYVLSFLVVAIMWVNHHHMLHSARHVTARLMWSNNLLLFCMSLIPFATGYIGETHGAALPTAFYGLVLTACSVAFNVLLWSLSTMQGDHPEHARPSANSRRKSLIAFAFYAASIPLAFVWAPLSQAIFVGVALAYFLPERKPAERPSGPTGHREPSA